MYNVKETIFTRKINHAIGNCVNPTKLGAYAKNIFEKKSMQKYFFQWSGLNKAKIDALKELRAEQLYIAQLDFMVTERCSLRCRECLNLMQYYRQPKDIPLSNMLETIDVLSDTFDEIEELRILGGEPFMNPQVYDVCRHAASKDHIKYVVLFTNGTIMPDRERLKLLDKKKTVFYISYYGVGKQKPHEMVRVLDEAGIVYCLVDFSRHQWIRHSGVNQYIPMERARRNEFFACCAGRSCPTVCDDRFFLCEYIANATRLQAVPDDESNYVLLDRKNSALKKELRCYITTSEAPNACSYCARLMNESGKEQLVAPGEQAEKPLEYERLEK